MRAQTFVGLFDYEEESDLFTACLYFPSKLGLKKTEALEMLNEANVRTQLGQFECVGDDMALRFRRSVDLRVERITMARLDQLVQDSQNIAERELPRFMPLQIAPVSA